MGLYESVRDNKVFFIAFAVLLAALVASGAVLGARFASNGVFFALCMMALQLINLHALHRKLKIKSFTPAPQISKIIIIQNQPKKRLFFAMYKLIVWLAMAMWFAVLARLGGIDVAGVLVGASAGMICAIAQYISSTLNSKKDKISFVGDISAQDSADHLTSEICSTINHQKHSND